MRKLYKEDKYLLKKERPFLKWISQHLSVILYEIELSKTKKERDIIHLDLSKIQKVILRRIKKYYDKKRRN